MVVVVEVAVVVAYPYLYNQARSGRLERALAVTAATLGLTRLVIAEVAVRHPAKLVMETVSLHAQLASSAAQQAELEAKRVALSARKPEEKVQRTLGLGLGIGFALHPRQS